MTTATLQRKTLSPDLSVNDGEREIVAVMTTNAVDRENEVLLPEGMDTKEFMRNPIVFANHQYGVRDVVGRVTSMTRQKDRWLVKIHMLPKPPGHADEWLADTVLHLAKYGVMGVSVGFMSMQARNPTKKDKELFGEDVAYVHAKWKLVELSIAPLPANPDALIMAVSKGCQEVCVKQFYPEYEPARKRITIRVPRYKAPAPPDLSMVRIEVRRLRGAVWA